MKLSSLSQWRPSRPPLQLLLGILLVAASIAVAWEYTELARQYGVTSLDSERVAALQEENENTVARLSAAESKVASLDAALTAAKNDADQKQWLELDSVLSQYATVTAKVDRNNNVKVDTSGITGKYGEWGALVLQKKYSDAKTAMAQAVETLDKDYGNYQASLVKPTPRPTSQPVSSSAQPSGYSIVTASTSRGNFSVKLIKMPLSSVTVKTVTANSSNCTNQCPAKSLAQYVAENGAYAGINGSYFCPPDYPSCAGKTYSYDFAVYNTNLGKWLNAGALSWNSEGLATFNSHSAAFYRYAYEYKGGPITAGIANFPTLLVYRGSVVSFSMDAAQSKKGTRGALGTDGTNVYLAVISNASLLDSAYAMQSLGATDVLNLDGGGSTALYIGGAYKAGPGRLLPNAVVLIPH